MFTDEAGILQAAATLAAAEFAIARASAVRRGIETLPGSKASAAEYLLDVLKKMSELKLIDARLIP